MGGNPASNSAIPEPTYTDLPVLPCTLHDYHRAISGTGGCTHCPLSSYEGESTIVDANLKRYHVMCFVAASIQLPQPPKCDTDQDTFKERIRISFPAASDMKLTRLCNFHNGKPILLDDFDVQNPVIFSNVPYNVDIRLRLLEIIRDKWPALGDANVSRLLVVADSPVIQSYTAGQKAELVKLSRTVYNRVTQSLYETAGSYTRTTSPLFGIPRGMVYDTSLIMALFVVMLKRLDAYVYAEGIDTCELHLRALHQANNWVASLFREHIDFTVRVEENIYYWTRGSHVNPVHANLTFLRAFKAASSELGGHTSDQFCISAVLANVLSVGCDSWGRPWQLPLPGASLPPGAKGRASDPTSKEGGRPRGSKGKGKGKDRTARDDRNIIGKSSNEPADSDEEEDEDEEEDMRIGEEEEGESTTTDTLAALLLSSRLDSPARLHYKTSHQG